MRSRRISLSRVGEGVILRSASRIPRPRRFAARRGICFSTLRVPHLSSLGVGFSFRFLQSYSGRDHPPRAVILSGASRRFFSGNRRFAISVATRSRRISLEKSSLLPCKLSTSGLEICVDRKPHSPPGGNQPETAAALPTRSRKKPAISRGHSTGVVWRAPGITVSVEFGMFSCRYSAMATGVA